MRQVPVIPTYTMLTAKRAALKPGDVIGNLSSLSCRVSKGELAKRIACNFCGDLCYEYGGASPQQVISIWENGAWVQNPLDIFMFFS